MTALWARIEAGSSEQRELRQALLAWASAARHAPGGLVVTVSEDLEQPGVYCLYSEWRGLSAVEEHLAGADFGILLGALQVLCRNSRFEVASRNGDAEGAGALIRRARMRHRDRVTLDSPPEDEATR